MKKQLTTKKVEQVIALAEQHQDYQTLLDTLNEMQDLSTVEKKVEESFVVNTKDPATPPIGKIKLAYENKAEIVIAYEETEDGLTLHFYGAAFTPNRDELKIFSVKDQKATPFFSKDLQAEPNKEEAEVKAQDDVTAQGYSWGDGCYPYYVMSINIGYSHCGKNCGDFGDLGGGSSRNAMDDCCQAHDRCWKNFGSGDCECDEILLDCAARNKWVDIDLYWAINAIFDRC